MKAPARIRLRLLGRFAVAYDDAGANPLRLSARKSCALVAYLAMSPEQTATREELATLLWGGCSDQQARQSLRQALALLRKELGSPHYFVWGPATIQLQPGIWSTDAIEFERFSRSSNADDLKRAATLFGGEFLTGLNLDEEGFDDWLHSQRQRSQTAAARLCETFVGRPDLVIDCEDALAAVQKLQALDPLREDWQRWALTLYGRYRGKHEAVAQAEAFAALLRRELDVGPEPESLALIEAIRDGSIATRTIPIATPAETSSTGLPVAVTSKDVSSQSAVPAGPPPRQWRHFRGRSGRRTAVALALGAFVAAVAGFGLTQTGPFALRKDVAPQNDPARVAPLADRSPRPRLQSSAAPTGTRIVRIVVLPFTTYGETAESIQSMADTLTDDLINRLSRYAGMRVVSFQTVKAHSSNGERGSSPG